MKQVAAGHIDGAPALVVPTPLWQRVRPDFQAGFMAIERVEKQLREFASVLDAAGVPYAVIGGNAVMAWVSTIDPDATRTTKDVDVLVRRSDMDRIIEAVKDIGLSPAEVGGVSMFVERDDPSARRAVHLVFADEPIKEHAPRPAPSVTTSCRSLQGFQVISLPELVRMKLEAFRRHDQVHLEDMFRVGLIDATVAAGLPDELITRLREIRDTMEWSTPPPRF